MNAVETSDHNAEQLNNPTTKESLQWFRERRDRWMTSPRSRIQPLKWDNPTTEPQVQQQDQQPFHSQPQQKDHLSRQKIIQSSCKSNVDASNIEKGTERNVNSSNDACMTKGSPSSMCETIQFAFSQTVSISENENSSKTQLKTQYSKKESDTMKSTSNLKTALSLTTTGASADEKSSRTLISVPLQLSTEIESSPIGFSKFSSDKVDTSKLYTASTGRQTDKSSTTSTETKLPAFYEGTQFTSQSGGGVEACNISYKESMSSLPLSKRENPVASQSYRQKLVDFYERYNPSKLNSVDKHLKAYKGREDKMFEKLVAKYCKVGEFLQPCGTGPVCFLDFASNASTGRVVIQLFADKVPLTAENFRCLCTGEKGIGRAGKRLCYIQSTIHRIVPNMCVQGGDITTGDGRGGESIYSPRLPYTDMWGKFKDENKLFAHDRPGLLSMANNGPDTNGSQFFITLKALPHLNGKHVIFGVVLEGMDLVNRISLSKTTNATQRPLEPVIITDCGEIKDINGKQVIIRASETI